MESESKVGAVREALRGGPKSRAQIKELAPHLSTKEIQRAIKNMRVYGAVHTDGTLFWLHPLIDTEDDYRQYVRDVSRARRAVDKPPIFFDRQRAAVVDSALRAWR